VTTKIPDHIEDGLRGILGIPTNRMDALRQLERELRACRSLAVAAEHPTMAIDTALDGVACTIRHASGRCGG
jgi:hypothetical protein